jgi:hypothetical protein
MAYLIVEVAVWGCVAVLVLATADFYYLVFVFLFWLLRVISR